MPAFKILLILFAFISCTQQVMTEEIVAYWPSGQAKIIHQYYGDKKDSTFTEFQFTREGRRNTIREFQNGTNDGLVIQFYESGNRAYAVELKNGKRQGSLLAWYEDGTIKSKMSFHQNVPTAVSNFYPNGQLIGDVTYKDGLVIAGTYFHENGQLRSKGTFDNGKKAGIWFNYDTLGVLIDSVVYDLPVRRNN